MHQWKDYLFSFQMMHKSHFPKICFVLQGHMSFELLGNSYHHYHQECIHTESVFCPASEKKRLTLTDISTRMRAVG